MVARSPGDGKLIHEKNHLTRAGRIANGNSPAATFEKVLRAFEMGGLSFPDLQLTLKQQLADGASPDELLKVIDRRELVEPLPEYAHAEILAIIQAEKDARSAAGGTAPVDQSVAQRAASGRGSITDADSDEPAMSRLLQALAADWDPEPIKGSAAFADSNALHAEIKTMRLALEQRDNDLVSLRNEHARVLGLLETRARSAAQLEADLRASTGELEAVQNALQRQQDQTRELREALAQKLAAEEAATLHGAESTARSEAALRQSESFEAELIALQEAVAARDTALQEARRALEEREAALHQARRSLDERDSTLEQTRYSLTEHDAALDQARQLLSQRDDALDQARHSLIERQDALDQARRLLAERDAQIASLQEKQAAIAALEMRAQSAEKMRLELQDSRERVAALEADLITAHTALGAEQNRARRLDGAVAEKNALVAEKNSLSGKIAALQRSLDERTAELAAQKQEQAKIAAGFAKRTKALESELEEARRRVVAQAPAVPVVAAAVANRAVAEPPVVAAPSVVVPTPAAVKPTLEVAEFALPPQKVQQPKVAIEEFALSLPIDWLRNRLVRTAGLCAAAIALVIGIWALAHHRTETKPPEVSMALIAPPAPGTVIKDCEACPALTVLPAGRFKQGSAEASASAFVKPMHWVAIERPFAMMINDVTVADFRAFATATGRSVQGCDVYDGQWKHQATSSWQNPGFEQGADHPVTCVSWNDAKAYAQWLSAQTGHHYRLPSASEWGIRRARRAATRGSRGTAAAPMPARMRTWRIRAPCTAIRVGSVSTAATATCTPRRSVPSRPAPLGCMTCWGMCSNGPRIVGTQTMSGRRSTAPRAPTATAASMNCAAVRGSRRPNMCAPTTAITSRRIIEPAASASDSRETFNRHCAMMARGVIARYKNGFLVGCN